MSLIVRLEGELAERVEHRAQKLGVSPEELVNSTIRQALDRADTDFERAMYETLEKNRELYRRLAEGPK
jgi:hypothetical protein